jgi:hypothetical protein
VRLLDSAVGVTQSISQWGVGARKAVEGEPDKSAPAA